MICCVFPCVVSSCLDLTSPFMYGTMALAIWEIVPIHRFFLPVGKFFKNILSVCVPTHTVNRRLVDPRSIQGESTKQCPKRSSCPDPFHMTNSTCRTQSAHCTVLVQWKSKTILPKCVACSVPQYNKPNARGVCESHVHLTYIHGLSVYGVTHSVP